MTAREHEMDDADRHILDLIQSDFPLTATPYADLAARLEMREDDVLARVTRLKHGVIRQISAIFDTRALGYQSSLVAARVPADRVEHAARVINQHPGVSHNYLRDHEYNIWFTVAVPPSSSLEQTVARLGELAGADPIRLMPTLQLFKIGVELNMGDQPIDVQTAPAFTGRDRAKPKRDMDDRLIALVRELQEDLPVEHEPFAAMAARLGLSVPELFSQAQAFKDEGRMRRFAAILAHRAAGFVANGMGVWAVPDDRIDEVGAQMAGFKAVSHCYQRPTYPDWPYNIFSMIHGRTKEDCQIVLDAIQRVTGVSDYTTLYSTQEFKKVRLKYYTPKLDQWEAKHLRPAEELAAQA
jgi:DNA-binding Lrp family transcriptional regulator